MNKANNILESLNNSIDILGLSLDTENLANEYLYDIKQWIESIQ